MDIFKGGKDKIIVGYQYICRMETEKIKLSIKGMTCGHCQKHVKNIILGVNGVKQADVDLNKASADVELEKGKATKEDIIKAVNESETYKAE